MVYSWGEKIELPILDNIIYLDWVHFVGKELVLAAYCCDFLFGFKINLKYVALYGIDV